MPRDQEQNEAANRAVPEGDEVEQGQDRKDQQGYLQ